MGDWAKGVICRRLYCRLAEGPLRGTVHSAFATAVNVETPGGLVTILAGGRGLGPWSLRLPGDLPRRDALGEVGLPVTLYPAGLWGPGGVEVVFPPLTVVDLTLPAPAGEGAELPTAGLEPLSRFLDRWEGGRCLAPLVTGAGETQYSGFLRPRLCRLVEAVQGGSLSEMTGGVAGFAGCGAGLTPASDDFLCGYLAVLYRRGRITGDTLQRLTETAAIRTTAISANLLRRLGEGCVSQPVLALLEALAEGGEVTQPLLEGVAALGSTSGTDLLSGIFWGLRQCAVPLSREERRQTPWSNWKSEKTHTMIPSR